MSDSSMAILRADLLAAQAQVLHARLATRRAMPAGEGALSCAVTALLAARSSLASLGAERVADLLGSSPARRVAASDVCE